MEARRRFPWHGWLGLGWMVAVQIGLAAGVGFVPTWLTPLMWTGYILAADGFTYWLIGRSRLVNQAREFPLIVLLSVGFWLLFEVYNLRLQNWLYRGLPESALLRDIGYFWSFATILPGILESADLIRAVSTRLRPRSPHPPRRHSALVPVGPSWGWFLTGLAFVTIPPFVPSPLTGYLFGFVWIGFALLLDPINEGLGLTSFRRELAAGRWGLAASLAAGGFLCGLLWEAWNFQAFNAGGAHWVYTIPQGLRLFGLHYGQMPLLGLLGFPPFALELAAMLSLARHLLGGDRVFGGVSA
jgi:hypothetical protein